jgi:uncharacterized membrane protein
VNAFATRPITPPLLLTVALFAVVYGVLGLVRHWHFGTGYDLAIFDQAVWHMSRFEAPASTVSGYANILGDHFYPILALFAPLYWIAPAPEALIVAQAILLAASMVPVFWFARARLSERAALGLCVAYGLFWGMQRTALADVHEMAFAPLFIALALWAIDNRRWRLLWIVSGLLVLVKEDLIPLVGAFGAFLIFRGERRQGALMITAASIVFAVVLWIVIPWFNNGAGWNTGGAFRAVWEQPWAAPAMVVSPPGKLRTMLIWLAPFAFLPLRSPYALLLIPVALARLLSSSPTHWGAAAHYSAPLAPILAMSAGDGLARIAQRVTRPGTRGRLITAVVSACIVIAAIVPGHQPHWRAFRPDHYQAPPNGKTGPAAFAMIPATASLVAQATIAPHLSQRETIYILKPGAPDSDYVVAALDLDPWPVTREEMAALVSERKQRGYVPIFEQDSWIVLRRSAIAGESRVP